MCHIALEVDVGLEIGTTDIGGVTTRVATQYIQSHQNSPRFALDKNIERWRTIFPRIPGTGRLLVASLDRSMRKTTLYKPETASKSSHSLSPTPFGPHAALPIVVLFPSFPLLGPLLLKVIIFDLDSLIPSRRPAVSN